MNNQTRISCCALAAVLLMAACSKEEPPPTVAAKESAPKPKAGPPVPVAALSVFFEMYQPVRKWAPDVYPLSLASGEIPGIKNEGGKAALWTAVFVSPSRREARTVVHAVADSGSNIHEGVSVTGGQPWAPSAKSKPFQVTAFAVDSDAAYKTAMIKAGPWVKKHPDKKLNMYLATTPKSPGPVWILFWGDEKTGYLAHIDATTGVDRTGK